VCLDCGRVDEFVDELIEKRQRTVAEQNGYSLAPQNLALYGHCAECRGREPKPAASTAVGRDTRRGR
jgi:Fur family ferric uptake transcriptional regulator